MSFELCIGCRRHVRASETACPFCGSPERAPRPRKNPTVRAAMFALGAAATGCSDDGTAVPVYGAPMVTTTSTSAGGGGAGGDGGQGQVGGGGAGGAGGQGQAGGGGAGGAGGDAAGGGA